MSIRIPVRFMAFSIVIALMIIIGLSQESEAKNFKEKNIIERRDMDKNITRAERLQETAASGPISQNASSAGKGSSQDSDREYQCRCDKDYDTLGGKGWTGANVLMTEPPNRPNDMELQFLNKGKVKSISAELDPDTGNSVLVVGFRFTRDPKCLLIRRYPVSVALREDFQTYLDDSFAGEDHIVFSSHDRSGELKHYPLEHGKLPAMYPYGHEKNPCNEEVAAAPSPEKSAPAPVANQGAKKAKPAPDEEDGGVKPFVW